MRDFIDLRGVSGADYRFRLWREDAAHLPIAGNYVVVREAEQGLSVLLADVSNDLSTVRQTLKRLLKDNPAAQVYTRLNVSRTVRTAENDDIVASYKPKRTAPSSPSGG
jgi:hypothetical protein